MEERRLALSQPQANTNLRLDGKVALVTGGGSGIGQAIALKFAAHGATVRVLDVSLGAGEETCRQITSAGGKASACACDVTDQKLVKETFTQLAANGPVSILVNNAGVSHIGTVESTTEADFDRVFRVNVKGYYNCMGYECCNYLCGNVVKWRTDSCNTHSPCVRASWSSMFWRCC